MSGPGRPGPAPLPREHGTTRGRKQHARRHETPCPPCKVARVAEDRERDARHRAEDEAREAELRKLRATVARSGGKK